MNISYHTMKTNLDVTRGYGTAGFNLVTSLQDLGHKVPFDDPSCPVQISFNMPPHYRHHDGQYKIGYTPWESTQIPASWYKYMQECDEVWATSEWVANVYQDNGITKPIYVYEHGLDNRWAPKMRKLDDKIHFLHVGEPALRKGGQMAVDAFREAFGDRTDVHLTVKAFFGHHLRTWGEKEFEVLDRQFDNITVIKESIPFSELLALYHRSHVLVYPSYGEGFGFIPLQALGTGMPVISTAAWAPYEDWITYKIDGRWDRSIWSVHPGNVFYPNYDDLVGHYLLAVDKIDKSLETAYDNSFVIHDEYDWVAKTQKAFEGVVKRFS